MYMKRLYFDKCREKDRIHMLLDEAESALECFTEEISRITGISENTLCKWKYGDLAPEQCVYDGVKKALLAEAEAKITTMENSLKLLKSFTLSYYID